METISIYELLKERIEYGYHKMLKEHDNEIYFLSEVMEAETFDRLTAVKVILASVEDDVFDIAECGVIAYLVKLENPLAYLVDGFVEYCSDESHVYMHGKIDFECFISTLNADVPQLAR